MSAIWVRSGEGAASEVPRTLGVQGWSPTVPVGETLAFGGDRYCELEAAGMEAAPASTSAIDLRTG